MLPLGAAAALVAQIPAAGLGHQSGAVFDTLMAQAAVRAGVTGLVTLSARHFARLGEDVRQLVVAPEA